MSEGEEKFEKTDAGASESYPVECGTIKKGSFMVFEGRPCKVVGYTTAKTGKHGHAKAKITGIDIFNGKKYEDSVPTSHTVNVPNIKRSAFTALDVDADGYLTLMDKQGNTRQDIRMPDETDDDKKLADRIREALNEGKEIVLTVLESMKIEKVVEMTEATK
jgi:translation initiation factor 5A